MTGIPILHIDSLLLVVNKPAGLRSIADGYDPNLPHLAGLLQAEHGRLWTVHRLDKDTSGVIVFTRTPEAHRDLSLQFERRQVRKEYHALVVGQPAWDDYEAGLPLRVNGDRRHRTLVDPQRGQPASTSLKVLRRFAAPTAGGTPDDSQHQPSAPVTLIAAFPQSGYTHQIRAHLAALRLPIYADPLYKSRPPDDRLLAAPPLPIQRTALHALRIAFTHPATGGPFSATAPYAQDFEAALQLLASQNNRS